MMQISDWIFSTMSELGRSGVDSPRRDALVILEDTLAKDRTWVLSHHDYQLNGTDLNKLDKLISRRKNREPLAYIRKKAWFYGRFFYVDRNVLIPRPETETIIEITKNLLKNTHPTSKRQPWKVLDIGTGSGCLAITTALEVPEAQVVATDVSNEALAIARKNAQHYCVSVEFLNSDLFSEVSKSENYDLIIANLPYVPDGLISSPEIKLEPRLALFAGVDGLDIYRKFWEQVYKLKLKPKYIITESLESQHPDMVVLAQKSSYKLIKSDVLVQLWEIY